MRPGNQSAAEWAREQQERVAAAVAAADRERQERARQEREQQAAMEAVKRGYITPLDVLEREAQKDNPAAQICRGQCYEKGLGVPKNLTEAAKWYRLAADQGYASGQTCLGIVYLSGVVAGIPKNSTEGLKYLRLAAEQGEVILRVYSLRFISQGKLFAKIRQKP